MTGNKDGQRISVGGLADRPGRRRRQERQRRGEQRARQGRRTGELPAGALASDAARSLMSNDADRKSGSAGMPRPLAYLV